MTMELTENECHFILIIRNFSFLRTTGYRPKEFILYGPETFIRYENHKLNQEVYIEWAPRNYLEIKIMKKYILKGGEFRLKNIFKEFEHNKVYNSPPINIDMPDMIEYNAKFIKQNLMPLIKGEMWIDELIKQKKKY